ncbi:MAG: hypothetical protein P1U46_01985 [Patescibacteria group bacterium]|nr:hypothetical protein [Patescibacteria group bacterium]
MKIIVFSFFSIIVSSKREDIIIFVLFSFIRLYVFIISFVFIISQFDHLASSFI